MIIGKILRKMMMNGEINEENEEDGGEYCCWPKERLKVCKIGFRAQEKTVTDVLQSWKYFWVLRCIYGLNKLLVTIEENICKSENEGLSVE